jgi:hypothetical protein
VTEPKKPNVPVDPLEMANNLTSSIRRMSERAITEPHAFMAERLGERSVAVGDQAAKLALVSIARDLRRIADHLTGGGS